MSGVCGVMNRSCVRVQRACATIGILISLIGSRPDRAGPLVVLSGAALERPTTEIRIPHSPTFLVLPLAPALHRVRGSFSFCECVA